MTPHTEPARAAAYARSLADAHRTALGFLPAVAYQLAADAGRLYTARENDDPAGFLLVGPFNRHAHVWQTCVQIDARRLAHATRLVNRLLHDAQDAGAHDLTLWCAEDLEANDFWLAAGFEPIGRRIRSKRRKRVQIGYRRTLAAGRKRAADLAADPQHQRRKQLLTLFGAMTPTKADADRAIRRLEK